MKRFIASLIVLSMMVISLSVLADAQRCYKPRRTNYSRYSRNYRARTYRTRNYYAARSYRTAGYTYKRPSFYRRHRNVINMGIATGGGALVGALLGGGRGAGIGALIGLGSGALYTYKLRPKKRRY